MQEVSFKVSDNWVNYRDENFLEHGGLFIRKDEYDNCYHVVSYYDASEDLGEECFILIGTGFVDISDTWIEWDSLADFSGLSKEDFNDCTDMHKVEILVSYYGIEEVGGEFSYTDKNEALETIKQLLTWHL